MQRISGSHALLVLGAVVGLVLVAWLAIREDDSIFLPVPYVRPLNAQATLQWEPEAFVAPAAEDDGSLHPGKALAQAHCVRCHALPSPNQLPRETWPFALTWMFNYLGYTNTYMPFGNNVEAALMPSQPLLSEEHLQSLAEYYLLYAPEPDALNTRSGESRRPTNQFQVRVPRIDMPTGELISMVKWDSRNRRLYVGRAKHRALQAYDENGAILFSKAADSEPIDVSVLNDGFRMTVMGDFMEDKQRGQVIDVTLTPGGLESEVLVDRYHRLTDSHSVDFDGDGYEDLLLVGFGAGSQGEVAVRWGHAGGVSDESTVLIDYSGALNAVVHDFDRDGKEDIVLLTSQSRQEILLWLNQGERLFEKKLIHQEFAGFGYNSIALADFDGDGWQDLVVCNGNNMEIRDAPLKPYHGVRIWRNQRDLTFVETYFYPMFGVLKAIPYDFDRDGDVDLAAIAFYPNWAAENPETFVYLENTNDGKFIAGGLSKEDAGRWISMGLGDVNGDGRSDLILGGGYIDQGVGSDHRDRIVRWGATRPSVVYLENVGGDRGSGR